MRWEAIWRMISLGTWRSWRGGHGGVVCDTDVLRSALDKGGHGRGLLIVLGESVD
jgi:hypothetical protein